MSGRKKALKVVAVAQMAVAGVIALTPSLVFPVCEAPMHCYYSYMAEIGTAAIIFAAAVAMLLSRGMESVRMLGVVSAVSGVTVILYPTTLIGVCGSPRMACHYGLLPVWNLMGGALILMSAAVFFLAKEDKV